MRMHHPEIAINQTCLCGKNNRGYVLESCGLS